MRLLVCVATSVAIAFVAAGCRSAQKRARHGRIMSTTSKTGADWDGTASDHAFIGFLVEFSPPAIDAFEVHPGDDYLSIADRQHSACRARTFAPYCDPRDVDKVWYRGRDGDMKVIEWHGGKQHEYLLRTGRVQPLQCGLRVTKVVVNP